MKRANTVRGVLPELPFEKLENPVVADLWSKAFADYRKGSFGLSRGEN
jgi:hypothetical protein